MVKLRTATLGSVIAFLLGMLLVWAVDLRALARDVAALESGGRWSDSDAAIPVTSNDPVWGSRLAPVTLVVFGDFEGQQNAGLMRLVDSLKTTYGRNKLRVVWKNNIVGSRPNARAAAVAAETVRLLEGNEAFWKFQALALASPTALNAENLERWAKQAGVQVDAYRQSKESDLFAAKVDADIALARQLRLEAPALFINGISLQGGLAIQKCREVIEGQLAKAEELLKNGVKASKVYVELSRANLQQQKDPRAAAPAASSSASAKRPDAPVEDTTVWKVPIEGSPQRGGKKALVTVVMFSDFQCPFCQRTSTLLAQLEKEYGDKVRVVWKDRVQAFHPRSEPAAEFAREARKQKGEEGFYAARDKLFENNTKLEDSDLERYAKELNLDVGKVKDAISKKAYSIEIQNDFDLAEDLKAQATPYLFVNGRRLPNPQAPEVIKKMVDEQLAKAEALVRNGTPAEKVYDKIYSEAVAPPPPQLPPKKDIPAPGKDAPSLGSAGAKIVVQLFSDFQCPYSKQAVQTMGELNQRYGKQVKVVWRNKPQPTHPEAPLAAEAAQEAFVQKGNEGFWRYHDLLFDNQAKPDGLKRPALENYAKQIGLDMTKFAAALDKRTHKPIVDADLRVAEAAGISATPSFSIQGYVLGGSLSFFELRKVLLHVLKETR